ncbi:topoisomerase [Clostridia bacterium]|nr:topoisomerase [Clostridia bacterium]
MTRSEQIAAAKGCDLVELAKRMGFEVKKSGNEYYLAEHDSLKISNNLWFWHSHGIGGSTIDFAMRFPYEKTFAQATDYVLETMGKSEAYARPDTPKTTTISDFQPPVKAADMSRVFAYLTATRHIDAEIVRDLRRNGSLYQSAKGSNCVFVGKDTGGAARYAFERGTLSYVRYDRDCAGSDKSYGFFMSGEGDTVAVFESPIDAMSHATLAKKSGEDYRNVHRLSLGGVSEKALARFLEERPDIKHVRLCLDNDSAGNAACERITRDFAERVSVAREAPKSKDFNEDLQFAACGREVILE